MHVQNCHIFIYAVNATFFGWVTLPEWGYKVQAIEFPDQLLKQKNTGNN